VAIYLCPYIDADIVYIDCILIVSITTLA